VDVFPDTPEQMASLVPDLVAAGANIIGGCCGTTPDHIRAIKLAVEQL
jgi:5-methyltetrahydrofolate--homocysteine methyltransferase